MNTFGSVTKTKILKIESHKLHVEFEAAAAIFEAQPVKLDSDGKIVPFAAADEQQKCIGIALMGGAIADPVTVATRGYSMIFAESATAVVPGPVKYAGYNGTTGYTQYEDGSMTDALATAWALDAAAGAAEVIRVLIKD